MSKILYSFSLSVYNALLHIASPFHTKAGQWVNGRKNILEEMRAKIKGAEKKIWVHCASLGEFEQGRPVIEKLKEKYPDHKLLLTFFSPSGYEIRKNYAMADWVFYLPLDNRTTASRFLDIVNPSMSVFVKYEYWYYYLAEMKKRQIPVLLISAIFRPGMTFFTPYGSFYRKILTFFEHVFVQDQPSRNLLIDILPADKITVAGDTRFDRVVAIAAHPAPLPEIKNWINNRATIIAGSTWPEDEAILQKIENLSLIICPHEVHSDHIEKLKNQFPDALLFSQLKNGATGNSRILIIDTIGILSSLYQYAWISYVGGGFGKGIHNTLEAAVYAKPVIFGPRYEKFKEAKDMIAAGAAFPVSDEKELLAVISNLSAEKNYSPACEAAGQYVKNNTGATEKIMNYIQEMSHKKILSNLS